MNKPDYSNFLAHFTRDGACVSEDKNILDTKYINMSAKEKLISILKEKKVRSSTMPWTNILAVCFTECPWSSFPAHSETYSPYGIGFSKSFIYNHHGAPVFYLRSNLFLKFKEINKRNTFISKEVDFLVSPFQPSYSYARKFKLNKTIDYTHEREWRTSKDLEFKYKDIRFVVIKSNDDLQNFPKEIRQEIGDEKFLVLDNYKLIEKLWPIHKI